MAEKDSPTIGMFSRFLDRIGKTMVASGLLLLAFVAYQLWGTGLAEHTSQQSLQRQFIAQKVGMVLPSGVAGRITIPAIDLHKYIVAGVAVSDLKRGPGLFPGSPLPGQLGNVAIAGHRTTYGAPFGRINEIKKNDKIVLETSSGTYTYIVQSAPRVIAASNVKVAQTVDPNSAIVTLVSCHPKWTSAKRIIVVGLLDSTVTPQPPTPLPVATKTVTALSQGWFHDSSAWPTVIVLALLLMATFGATKRIARRRGKLLIYPAGLVVFGLLLFVFFENVSRLLPTNL
jgi:sortase A